jgi:hypothetical protein
MLFAPFTLAPGGAAHGKTCREQDEVLDYELSSLGEEKRVTFLKRFARVHNHSHECAGDLEEKERQRHGEGNPE